MSATTNRAVVPSILAFEVEVVRTSRLSPHFLRVTFGGADLVGLDDGGPLGPRDLRVKLVLATPGHPLPDLGDLSGGWYATWLALDADRRGCMRTYTVREARVRGDGPPEVDVDFVLHPGAGTPGPAARWVADVRPGDRVLLLGPNAAAGHGDRPPGVEWAPPTGADVRVLLVGDETAVPAISSVLRTLSAGVRGHVVAEVPTAADFLDLPTAAHLQVVWCARNDRPRGAAMWAALEEVLDGLGTTAPGAPAELPDVDVDGGILWEIAEAAAGGWYAWLAGEAAVVRDLRRHLVGERGLDRRRVAFMGYWREGRAESA